MRRILAVIIALVCDLILKAYGMGVPTAAHPEPLTAPGEAHELCVGMDFRDTDLGPHRIELALALGEEPSRCRMMAEGTVQAAEIAQKRRRRARCHGTLAPRRAEYASQCARPGRQRPSAIRCRSPSPRRTGRA